MSGAPRSETEIRNNHIPDAFCTRCCLDPAQYETPCNSLEGFKNEHGPSSRPKPLIIRRQPLSDHLSLKAVISIFLSVILALSILGGAAYSWLLCGMVYKEPWLRMRAVYPIACSGIGPWHNYWLADN